MYKIIGADGREYGPATVEQLRGWIAEGRANATTLVQLEGTGEWKRLGVMSEFAALVPAAIAGPITPIMPSTPGGIRKTSGFATSGLICGILSIPSVLCCCGFPTGILGIVFSLAALSRINRYPDLYEGRNTAMIGLILSIAGLALQVTMIIVHIATGNSNVTWNFDGI